MKQILIELDDQCARDLELVAPAKNRQRANFIRLALRRAIDLALDHATREAYGAAPSCGDVEQADLDGWDAHNGLAQPAAPRRPTKPRSRRVA